jgi:Tol biopolymer transport system component
MRPPIPGGDPPENGDIWKVDVTPAGWGEPVLLPPPVNGPGHHDSSPTLTADGTLYFFSSRDGGYGKSDIYRSHLIDGVHQHVENLGPVINTEHSEYDLVVSPDESFLVFSSTRPGGFSDVDLYVSFRTADDGWAAPKNLGEKINATGAVFPSLTDDGKYLFFQSRPNDCGTIFWVDAAVIHALQ